MYLSKFLLKIFLKNAELPSVKKRNLRHIHDGLDIHYSGEVYLRDDSFTTSAGIINSHQTKGLHWVKVTQLFLFGFS